MSGSPADNYAQRRIYEQCLLMHYLTSNVEGAALAKDDPDGRGLSDMNKSCKYTSFIPVEGSPTEMMSILTGRGDLESILDLTPFQLSFLVPKVRLYKTYVAEDFSKSWDVELKFADNISGIIEGVPSILTGDDHRADRVQRMLESRAGRGTGVGITGFSWKYEGTNPAEAANLLSANLSIHFNDMQELFQKRGPFSVPIQPYQKDGENVVMQEDCFYQYVDLIMRSASTQTTPIVAEGATTTEPDSNYCKWQWLYDPSYFELKAVVGWNFKQGAPFNDEQLQALNSASVILYLTIVDHVISYNEDGTMSLEISYKAAIEGVLDDPNTDLLLTTWERARQAQVEAMYRSINQGADQDVTGAGTVSSGGTDAYGTRQGTSPTSVSDSTSADSTDQIAENLSKHLEDIRILARNMNYEVLLMWLSDEAFMGGITNLEDEQSHQGRKLEEAPENTPYAEDLSDSDYATPKSIYGPPWHLSYGPIHGAKTVPEPGGPDDGQEVFDSNELGLPRIKQIWVPAFEALNIEASDSPTGVSVSPPWWAQERARRTETPELDVDTDQLGGGSTFANDDTNAAADMLFDDVAADSNLPRSESGNNSWTEKMQEINATMRFNQSENDGKYPLRFVYYGDILDWAIRKALWRPPYTPDSMYLTLDGFVRMHEQNSRLKGPDNHWTGPRFTNTLDVWGFEKEQPSGTGESTLYGPDGTRLTIESAVDKLENLKKRKLDKINIILGCVEYYDPFNKTVKYINLADIPISLTRWNQWFVDNILRSGVYSLSLSDFIKRTMRSLILDILGGTNCYNTDLGAQRQHFDIGISNFTLPAFKDGEDWIDPAKLITRPQFFGKNGDGSEFNEDGSQVDSAAEVSYRLNLSALKSWLDAEEGSGNTTKASLFSVSEENTEVFHFISIYARGYEVGTLLGIESDAEMEDRKDEIEDDHGITISDPRGDHSKGIFHFYLGQNQGLVKSVRFTRTDQQYLAEARMFGHGAFGYNQLRGRYEATIVMQGNTFFLPGQLIYINPDSVGSGDLDSEYEDTALLLGLGGYYTVLDIQSTVTAEFFETEVKCVWVGSGRPEICSDNTASGITESGGGATFTPSDATAFELSLGDVQ